MVGTPSLTGYFAAANVSTNVHAWRWLATECKPPTETNPQRISTHDGSSASRERQMLPNVCLPRPRLSAPPDDGWPVRSDNSPAGGFRGIAAPASRRFASGRGSRGSVATLQRFGVYPPPFDRPARRAPNDGGDTSIPRG